ncbi:MAG TPA: hypothetical protein VGD01_07910 [Candidatus Elarobacter sp.]|jgi:hypothetical protein
MQATRFAKPVVDGMWNAQLLRMLHPGYRFILRWCDHLAFEDVLRIDRASIVEAATDPKRFAGPIRLVFGAGHALPTSVVPFGLVNCTHRYMLESGTAPPESAIFAEVHGEPVTRASLRDALHHGITLLRLAGTIAIDDDGRLT